MRNRQMTWVQMMGPLVFAILLFSGCPGSGGGGGEGSGSTGGGSDTGCFDCKTSSASFLHLDSEEIAAIVSVDPGSIKSSASLSVDQPALIGKGSGDKKDSPLRGIDRLTGELRNILRCFTLETDKGFSIGTKDDASCWGPVPRIVTIAQCQSQVYLVFERPFIVRTRTPEGKDIKDYPDPWSHSSPFTSQLLRTKAKITNYKAGDRVERSNLEPVLSSLEINTWDRKRNIQFDGDCNLYVTAHVPGTSNNVLLKIEPGSAENKYSEVINANICYRNWQATRAGDLHYTGNTSADGKDCSGESFYRTVSRRGVLTEITRGWWDYVFEPQDDGTVIFYGPDPTESGVPGWDKSCLFRFDGTKSGSQQYTKLVDCTNDWHRYVRQGPTTTGTDNDSELKRCSQQFYTYRGSNTPKKILSIDRDGDGTKEICTVADVEHKQAGTWKCDICVNSGSNCENKDGVITGDTTQTDCEKTTGNKWVSSNKCYNAITTNACTITMPTGWKLNHSWCQDPGSSWSRSYSALSCIKSDKSVELLSDSAESVTRAWVVGKRLLYSAVKGGTYSLKAVTFDSKGAAAVTELVSGIEMYEVALDPTRGTDRLLVNGLRFSDNSYVFGTYDFSSKELKTNTSLTGRVETILVVGGN